MDDSLEQQLDRFVGGATTSEVVVDFLEELRRQGILAPERSRLLKTALRQFGDAARSAGRPDSAEWLLEHLDELSQSIAVGQNGQPPRSPSTVATYRSRAEAAIRQFQELRSNPVAFYERMTRTIPRKRGDAREAECSLGGGRVFRYLLPRDGIRRADVHRIAMHLLAAAEDFGGSSQLSDEQLRLFAGDKER